MPLAPRLGTLEGTESVYERLKALVPVIRGPVNPALDTGGQQLNLVVTSAGGPTRMINRSRTLSVTVAPTAVVVETSTYSHYEAFAEIIEEVLRATAESSSIAGIQRVGLRYIDEIRIPGVEEASDWSPYVNASLLVASTLHTDLKPAQTEGQAEFVISENQRTQMRFGAMRRWMVDPNGILRLRRSEDGPFFLIDLDSFWTASQDDIPEFGVDEVLRICESLRRPVRTLFEAAITDRLRDEVLRKEAEA